MSGCTELAIVDLGDCEELTAAGLEPFLSSLPPKLQYLDLRYCPKLDGACVRSVSRGAGPAAAAAAAAAARGLSARPHSLTAGPSSSALAHCWPFLLSLPACLLGAGAARDAIKARVEAARPGCFVNTADL